MLIRSALWLLLAASLPGSTFSAASARSFVTCENGTVALPGQPCPLPGPFVIIFTSGATAVETDQLRVLDHLVERHRAYASPALVISGHADHVGSASANHLLSRRRAEAVARLLQQRGIAPATMRIEAHGETRPLVSTTDGGVDRYNRRVEIRMEAPAPTAD
ncbi:MAG TPA: OmpA family protein [Allosphingosinicella sp.]|jgi:outer membrane protein OmpA-like peptidoglycan-associated protein